jgi:hypothetical protein
MHNQTKTFSAHTINNWINAGQIVSILIIILTVTWSWLMRGSLFASVGAYQTGSWLAAITTLLCMGVFIFAVTLVARLHLAESNRSVRKFVEILAGSVFLVGLGLLIGQYSLEVHFPDSDARQAFYGLMGFVTRIAFIVVTLGIVLGVYGLSYLAISAQKSRIPRT